MSVKLMSLVWDLPDLTQSETLVLLALADHADESGECWPSVDRVAEKARIKRRAAQRVIGKLEDSGLIEVDRSRNGRGQTSRYTLHVEHPIEKGVRETPKEKRVSFATEKGVRSDTPPVSPTTPVREPSSNHHEPPREVNKVAWASWTEYRKERRLKPYTATGAFQQMSWLANFRDDEQAAIVDQSIRQGWQGLFPLRERGNGERLSAVERVRQATGGRAF